MNNLTELHKFIVSAKAATYVGDGKSIESCRKGSHDLSFIDGNYRYLDSYFGGSNFIGEEIVYENEIPVWGMNYYGSILKPQKITAAETGAIIKASLSQMYAAGRFLGGWEHIKGSKVYHDSSKGDLSHFTGYEWIEKKRKSLRTFLPWGFN
ncbi:MAG: DUF5680 domain-containing protein [Brevefilum sp.]|nr:DUF5680 domain-containing protein [Brevefilum sp.]